MANSVRDLCLRSATRLDAVSESRAGQSCWNLYSAQIDRIPTATIGWGSLGLAALLFAVAWILALAVYWSVRWILAGEIGLLERLGLRKFKPTPLGEILDPTDLRRMTPEELAAYRAEGTFGSKRWFLADIEQRRREGWSGPDKWNLGVSLLALAVAAYAAIFRS